MPKGIGRCMQIGIAKESVRGTSEAAASFYIPVSEFSIDEMQEHVIDEQGRGVIEDAVDQEIIKQWAEGNFTAPIGDAHFGLILLSLLGTLNSVVNADASTLVYDHTATVEKSAQHQSQTLFIDDPLAAQDYKHALGVITNVEIQYVLGAYVQYVIGLKSKKGETATLTPSTTSENRFTAKHFVFKTAANKAGLDAGTEIKLKNFTLTIEKNIEDDDVLGDDDPIDFLNKQIAIEGEIEAYWQNESDFKTDFLAGTEKAIRMQLINSDVTIGTAANPELKIDLAKVKFTALSRPVTINDIVTQTLSFKAFYSISDTEMIEVVLTNLETSY